VALLQGLNVLTGGESESSIDADIATEKIAQAGNVAVFIVFVWWPEAFHSNWETITFPKAAGKRTYFLA